MDDLRRDAMAAYEQGRRLAAAPWVAAAMLLTVFGAAISGFAIAPLAVGLVGVVGWARVHGRGAGRGAAVGLASGSIGMVAVGAWTALGSCCGDGCSTACLPVCCAAGVIGAAAVSRWLWGQGTSAVVVALGVFSLAVGLACVPIGAMGLVAVAVAAVLSVPAALAPARA